MRTRKRRASVAFDDDTAPEPSKNSKTAPTDRDLIPTLVSADDIIHELKKLSREELKRVIDEASKLYSQFPETEAEKGQLEAPAPTVDPAPSSHSHVSSQPDSRADANESPGAGWRPSPPLSPIVGASRRELRFDRLEDAMEVPYPTCSSERTTEATSYTVTRPVGPPRDYPQPPPRRPRGALEEVTLEDPE